MRVIEYIKQNYRVLIKSYGLILVGSILLALGVGMFLIPNQINSGGLSGIAIILHALNPWFEEDIVVLVLNWLFFFISLIFLGLRFTIKSLVSTLVFPLFLVMFTRIPLFQNISDTFIENQDTSKTLIAGLFGGAFVGAGVALTFLGGGSTGGVDIIVFLINKFTAIKQSILSFLIDGLIIAFGIFALGNMIASLIGIIAAFITAMMIEYIFVGRSKALTALIISKDHALEINDYIQNQMERGSTIFKVEGGYQRHSYELIMVSFDRKEYANLINKVASIDKKAFVTIIQTNEVLGEGFRAIRTRKRGFKQ